MTLHILLYHHIRQLRDKKDLFHRWRDRSWDFTAPGGSSHGLAPWRYSFPLGMGMAAGKGSRVGREQWGQTGPPHQGPHRSQSTPQLAGSTSTLFTDGWFCHPGVHLPSDQAGESCRTKYTRNVFSLSRNSQENHPEHNKKRKKAERAHLWKCSRRRMFFVSAL